MAEQRIPIIRLRGILLVSVQVELSDRVVLQLKEDVTQAVRKSDGRGLILDLTGIDFMDSYISRAVRDVIVMTGLMGVPSVVCGIHPSIAMTMVEMGVDLQGAPMALNLDAALDMFSRDRTGPAGFDELLVDEDDDQELIID